MRMAAGQLVTLGSCVLLACGLAFGQQPAPTAPQATEEEQVVQQLLGKLTELSKLISREPQSWQHQMSQADVMFKLAHYSKGKEREDWLRVASESVYAAAVQAPENQPSTYQQLQQLPSQIQRTYPESKVWSHVARQVIQAEYVRTLSKQDADPTKAQAHLRDRLVAFANEHQDVPEAPEAAMEAASISESMKSVEDAVRCYRHVATRYAGTPAGRLAAGRQWRLGGVGTPVALALPCLYAASSASEPPYDLSEARGKVVVLYFWSCGSNVEADFPVLKQLNDRYQYRGLQVVYVNLDDDSSKVREYLKGKLVPGVHIQQQGGLKSEMAGQFGLKALPEAMLVGPDGKLIAHSLTAARLGAVVAEQFGGK
jgi:hypothetical protein